MSWDQSVVLGISLTGFFFLVLHLVKKKQITEDLDFKAIEQPMRVIEVDVYLVLSLVTFWFLSNVIKVIVSIDNTTGALDTAETLLSRYALLIGYVMLLYALGLIVKIASIGLKEFERLASGFDKLDGGK